MHALPTRSLAPLLLLAACAAPVATHVPTAEAGRPLPTLEEATRVWDSRAGRELSLSELLDRLAREDVVFVGETHLDDTTHRVEAAILEGLIARRSGRVVLSLEMFERDVQPVLDDYLAGRLDEPAFLAASRPWGNYRTDYRPLIELARAHGLPVVAANAPAALRRRVSSGGRAALEALSPAERGLLPAEIFPAAPTYWERVDRATRGHMNFASLPEEQRLFSGQNLWDNSMGAACAEALAAHPGHAVVHVVGGFHVQYHDGTAAQLRRRAPGARVAVVEVVPESGLHSARPARDAEQGDYLVYALGLARSLSDGALAVSVPGELRYTLDVPSSARADAPAPLLVWLPDGDERPADARALLVAALGEKAAVAVLEPPLPARASDLAPAGSWSGANAFRADQARVQGALDALVEYVTRRLPVSAERVVVAGRGSGATAVLWSAMYGSWLEAEFVALRPRGAGALHGEGLPDRPSAARGLRLLVGADQLEASRWIEDDFRTIGTPATLEALSDEPPESDQLEARLRTALGLAPRAERSDAPVLCVLERELPRARQWAEIFARRLARAGRPARVVAETDLVGDEDPTRVRRLRIGAEWPLSIFAEGGGLPLAVGDFGGTTVLVIPASADTSEREAWQALEREQVLRKRSPFAGLRVALAQGEPSLASVLGELAAKGSRSVLVVPAVFCASPAEMRALADSLDESLDRATTEALDLAWLPGLGGELCAGAED